MTTIPGTKVNLVYNTVPPKHYPHLYYTHHETGPAMVSLNAGNSPGLYVGGGGLNAAFKALLVRAGQDVTSYTSRHVALVKAAMAGGSNLADYGASDDDPTLVSCVDATKVAGAVDYTGVAFADIFADKFCPEGNPANRGMFYVAPPDGHMYSDKAKFLGDVAATAEHGVNAVNGYNAWTAQNGGVVVQAIRLSLYSSNIYVMAGVPVSEVALAIWKGIEAGCKAQGCVLSEIQMPVTASGNKEDYFNAVQDLME